MSRPASALLLVCLVLALLGSTGTAASEPVALVLSVSDAITPTLPYVEVDDGTEVKLRAAGRVVFQHYVECRKVTVRGGTVTFTAGGYRQAGGVVESETRVACPRRVTLKRSGEVAGSILRKADGPEVTMSGRPAVLLIGPGASSVTAVRVAQAARPVFEGPVKDREFRWPSDRPALTTGGVYELVFVSEVASVPVTFTATAPRPLGLDPIVVITLE